MKYTKKDLSLQESDDPKTEEICKLICIEEGVINPDQVVTSFPQEMLEEQVHYAYWEYRLPMVRKILEIING